MVRVATGSARWCAASWLMLVIALCATRVDAQAAPSDPAARQERAAELTERGARLVQRGDPGSAVWYLREALRIDPGFARAASELANIYLARDDLSAARQVAVDVLERAPSSAALWLVLHRALMALGDLQGGADALREGLRYCPDDVTLLQVATELSLQRGEWLRALSLQRALLRADATSAASASKSSELEAALHVLIGTSDRARGLRCEEHLSPVRLALARCTTYEGRMLPPALSASSSTDSSSPVNTTRN